MNGYKKIIAFLQKEPNDPYRRKAMSLKIPEITY